MNKGLNVFFGPCLSVLLAVAAAIISHAPIAAAGDESGPTPTNPADAAVVPENPDTTDGGVEGQKQDGSGISDWMAEDLRRDRGLLSRKLEGLLLARQKAKVLNYVGWPMAVIGLVGGTALTAWGAGAGMFDDSDGGTGFASISGGLMGVGVAGLIIGSIGAVRGKRAKRLEAETLKEINAIDADIERVGKDALPW